MAEVKIMTELRIDNLHASVQGKDILHGVDLFIKGGETHALMGPNGSGKSTLAAVLLGHPSYVVTKGKISLNGQDITQLPPDERSRRGLFLAFQNPSEISGISLSNMLRTAFNAHQLADQRLGVLPFQHLLKATMAELHLEPKLLERGMNEGFSGGEKKKVEMLQLALLKPAIAVLDETDSGLDIDALKIVAEVVNKLAEPERGFLIITHYQRILQFVKPQFVHILTEGKIVRSGGSELANDIETQGYDQAISNSA